MKRILLILFLFSTFFSALYAQSKAGHDYVDLALPSGTKWATCNIGADSFDKYGEYFAWGEIEPKKEYSWSNSKWYDKPDAPKIAGDVRYDAATYYWGDNWETPSIEDFQELIDFCDWCWTDYNGIFGYKITSKNNGNSIFLPAAGEKNKYFECPNRVGNYWSSTYNEDDDEMAYLLFFTDDRHKTLSYGRSLGFTIRPVTK